MATPFAPPPPPRQPEFTFGGYAGPAGGLLGVGFWPRAGARIIDLIVHYVVYFAASIFFAIMLGVIATLNHVPTEPLVAKMAAFQFTAFVLAYLGSVAYHTICEAGSGQSLGKLAIGAVVVQEDGAPCGFKPALIRSFAYFVDALFFGIIGYMQMNKTPQQQRYGDTWGHTLVVKKDALPPTSGASGGRFFAMFVLACLADAATALLGLALKMV
jgi:uncharacterized RDD family membrane protein YckC